jgi:hypothetical protein
VLKPCLNKCIGSGMNLTNGRHNLNFKFKILKEGNILGFRGLALNDR